MGARQMVEDFRQGLLGGRGPDLRLRAGAQPLRQGGPHLNALMRGTLRQRLRVGIGDDELHPIEAAFDHVVDGVAAGTPDPENGDARLEFGEVRNGKIDAHVIGVRKLISPT